MKSARLIRDLKVTFTVLTVAVSGAASCLENIPAVFRKTEKENEIFVQIFPENVKCPDCSLFNQVQNLGLK